nr:hypothetical protein [Candidatus Freyarchaeota archaeon]
MKPLLKLIGDKEKGSRAICNGTWINERIPEKFKQATRNLEESIFDTITLHSARTFYTANLFSSASLIILCYIIEKSKEAATTS